MTAAHAAGIAGALLLIAARQEAHVGGPVAWPPGGAWAATRCAWDAAAAFDLATRSPVLAGFAWLDLHRDVTPPVFFL